MPAFPYTADYFSGLTATTAALAALHKVRETGKGESIDIAMYEVMLRMGQYFMMDYFNGGEMCPRMTKGKILLRRLRSIQMRRRLHRDGTGGHYSN